MDDSRIRVFDPHGDTPHLACRADEIPAPAFVQPCSTQIKALGRDQAIRAAGETLGREHLPNRAAKCVGREGL